MPRSPMLWRWLPAVAVAAAGCDKDPIWTRDDTDAPESPVDTPDDSGEPTSPDRCPVRLEYTAQGSPAEVFVAGAFNDWSDTADALSDQGGGRWLAELSLPPGAYPYKLVEATGADGRIRAWTCDPDAEQVQCDEGYTWSPGCGLDVPSCNSLLVVPACDAPLLASSSLRIDRSAGAVDLAVTVTPAFDGAAVETVRLEVDGQEQTGPHDLGALRVTGLSPGRHTLRVTVTDRRGRSSEPLVVPFWTDARRWDSGLLYFVFVDRFNDAVAGNNGAEGTTHPITDYYGGDWQGVIDKLDYLDGLGVTALWITAPQDNPGGAWGDKCDATFSGFHGYWPAHPDRVEGHFGSEADFRALVDAAHARGMRVLVDWVANHVHQDHPYAQSHPDWFNPQLICQGDVWNSAPEVCWFDAFLPDIRYYDVDPLVTMVDDAVRWAKDYGLDGYRVDAVKHMPHSVYANLQARIGAELEHRHAGGDEEFYTVGETYSTDRGLIGSYVNPRELDAQFDFPMYWAILSALGRNESSLVDLEAAFQASRAAYGGALMSTFLGNHDVERFVAHAEGEVGSLYGDGPCGGDGRLRSPDSPPGGDVPYQRLKLAWTWLLTNEGLPLIYYGDEIGLEGYGDPDNRHPMRFEGQLSAPEQAVLDRVRILGQARRAHPALSVGTRVNWWSEPDVLGWARVSGEDHALVVINRSGQDRTLSNGMSFAGLDAEGRYRDLLTGDTFRVANDHLDLPVPAMGARVLVRE